MQTPARITSPHCAAVLPPSSSLETGIANMARPTPNHPTCVKLVMADGR